MLYEVDALNYLEGVRKSFEASMVVVTGLVSPREADEIGQHVPLDGKHRVYLRPLIWKALYNSVEPISETREQTKSIVANRLGPLSTLYLQRPDMLRRGSVGVHTDGRTIALSTSVNLDNGNGPTRLMAERVADADAPYSEILDACKSINGQENTSFTDEVEIFPGDGVIIGRGVVHCSESAPDRESIVFRTRGIIIV